MKEFNSQKKYSKKIGSVRAAFDRASESYDNYSVLQRIAADRLIESLDQIKIKPKKRFSKLTLKNILLNISLKL